MGLDKLFDNCSEYLDILRKGEKGCFLIRGVKSDEIDINLFRKSIKQREPKGMPPKVHASLNEYFEKIFGWPVRNGIFTYGAKNDIKNVTTVYGTTYLFFPIGQFQFVYDSEVFDLYSSFSEFDTESDNRIDAFINSIVYSNKNINYAMSNIIREKKSAEIIVNCQEYYLVNLKYIDELIALIWK